MNVHKWGHNVATFTCVLNLKILLNSIGYKDNILKAQIEVAKEQAKIEADKELFLKSLVTFGIRLVCGTRMVLKLPESCVTRREDVNFREVMFLAPVGCYDYFNSEL